MFTFFCLLDYLFFRLRHANWFDLPFQSSLILTCFLKNTSWVWRPRCVNFKYKIESFVYLIISSFLDHFLCSLTKGIWNDVHCKLFFIFNFFINMFSDLYKQQTQWSFQSDHQYDCFVFLSLCFFFLVFFGCNTVTYILEANEWQMASYCTTFLDKKI